MFSKILFVEPPKDYWFVMGEYLPPPTVLLILAGYLESKLPDIKIETKPLLEQSKKLEQHLKSLRKQAKSPQPESSSYKTMYS